MKYLLIFISALILGLCLVVLESIRECRSLRVKRYKLTSEKINQNGIRAIMLADYHNNIPVKEKVLKKLRELRPDIVLVAGDMVVANNESRADIADTAKLLNEMAGLCPVIYGMGNHERGLQEGVHDTAGIWETYKKSLSKNVIILDNSAVDMVIGENKLHIMGLSLSMEYYTRLTAKPLDDTVLKDSVGYAAASSYNILIGHNPDYFPVYTGLSTELILSGHNHGGLVRLPILGGILSPRLHIFPKYDYGKYTSGMTNMLVTNGLGAHSIKIRINNIPELVYIEINSK